MRCESTRLFVGRRRRRGRGSPLQRRPLISVGFRRFAVLIGINRTGGGSGRPPQPGLVRIFGGVYLAAIVHREQTGLHVIELGGGDHVLRFGNQYFLDVFLGRPNTVV